MKNKTKIRMMQAMIKKKIAKKEVRPMRIKIMKKMKKKMK
jgi:hypothetical protein